MIQTKNNAYYLIKSINKSVLYHYFFCYVLNIWWKKRHPLQLSPPSLHHSFLFPGQVCFFFSFHSIYWSDGVTSCLPGGRPGASGVSPGGGWVKCRCGGWFPLMKYQYFTLLIYCRLTKHDTILSKLGECLCLRLCSFLPLVMTESMNRDKRYHRFLTVLWENELVSTILPFKGKEQ